MRLPKVLVLLMLVLLLLLYCLLLHSFVPFCDFDFTMVTK